MAGELGWLADDAIVPEIYAARANFEKFVPSYRRTDACLEDAAGTTQTNPGHNVESCLIIIDPGKFGSNDAPFSEILRVKNVAHVATT